MDINSISTVTLPKAGNLVAATQAKMAKIRRKQRRMLLRKLHRYHRRYQLHNRKQQMQILIREHLKIP